MVGCSIDHGRIRPCCDGNTDPPYFSITSEIQINQGHVLTHLINQQDGRHQIYILYQVKHNISITGINPNKHRE